MIANKHINNSGGATSMENLWILTEERPKASVIRQIISIYETDFNGTVKFENQNNIKIKPIFKDGYFMFKYVVEGIKLLNINEIIIKTVSGSSSFFDFLVFQQETEPSEDKPGNLLMAIEETKTSDDESRNTGVYQRASKFAFIDAFYKNIKLYMLYNDELENRDEKKPSDTSIFGTNMLLSNNVKIIGKDISKWFNPFQSLSDMIEFKKNMRQPPEGNVPIIITQYEDKIEVSGRLSKPATAGNIGHDPNIGALSLIAKTIRHFGWDKRIVITMHGVSQEYVDKTRGKNKFLYICNILGIELDGIVMPPHVSLPEKYWHYEKSSEKLASILLHMVGIYHGMKGVYQNHAGCERGYFKTLEDDLIALPKKDKQGINLYIPDLVLYDLQSRYVTLVEGKKLSTLQDGVREIENYDSIETEFIKPHYPGCKIHRCISIYGGNRPELPHPKVILYLSDNGKVFINPDSPQCIIDAFQKEGIEI